MNNDITDTIIELGSSDVTHCTAPWHPAPQFVPVGLETLPYEILDGARFERLCYELLLSKGLEPRFFGRSGQAQYGVDLVIDTPGRFEVYQCKNISSLPSERELTDILATFENGWLISKGLPRPNHFTICCPSILRDSDMDGKWLHLKQAFEQRTHVALHLWHRDLLDDWLKKLPDIVADLFSDRHAEAFCDIEDWAPDLFVRICEDNQHADPRLSRFFAASRTGHLYLDEEREQEISEAFARSTVVLLRGMPGAGKTFTAFALAGRSSPVSRRAYFVDVAGEEITRTVLRNGIRRRLSRPSLFILENCQNRVATLTLLLAELESSLGQRFSSNSVPGTARAIGAQVSGG